MRKTSTPKTIPEIILFVEMIKGDTIRSALSLGIIDMIKKIGSIIDELKLINK